MLSSCEQYANADIPKPVRAATREDEGALHPWLDAVIRKEHKFTDTDYRDMHAVYLGLITEVDDQVGRIVHWLRESGQYNRTLIILTSDHGEQMGDHHVIGKMGYFEATYRIPLIVRDPRPEADAARGSRVRSHFTEHVDLMPTLLDWLGLPVPAQCDGQSLLPFLIGEVPKRWRTEAHFEYDFRDVVDMEMERELGLAHNECSLAVVRGPRYKYVHFAALPPLFFDLETDPHELVNRASDPAMLPLVLQYAQKLLSWRMQHDEETLALMSASERGTIVRHLSNRV